MTLMHDAIYFNRKAIHGRNYIYKMFVYIQLFWVEL